MVLYDEVYFLLCIDLRVLLQCHPFAFMAVFPCRQSCRLSHWSHLSVMNFPLAPQLVPPAQSELVACSCDRTGWEWTLFVLGAPFTLLLWLWYFVFQIRIVLKQFWGWLWFILTRQAITNLMLATTYKLASLPFLIHHCFILRSPPPVMP